MNRLKFTKRESVSELLTSIANDHSFKKLYTKRDGVSESVSDKHSQWSDSGPIKRPKGPEKRKKECEN